MTINYHEHKYYKPVYQALQDYIAETYEGKDIPQGIIEYRNHLRDKIEFNPVSILDYPEDQLLDPDDCRYPNEQFLISLSETMMQISAGKFLKIMRLVCCAWYDFCDPETFVVADTENLTYRLYTCGWSGNEDIIDALMSNISIRLAIDMHWEGAVCVIKYRLSDGKRKENRGIRNDF